MKQIILAEFESVFLPFKEDNDKLAELEEMCRVLIALDSLGAHIIVYTIGNKNEILQFFSYFAPSILSQTDLMQIDPEPDSKLSIILSAINYHNQVSPESEHITDCFSEDIIVLDGDPDFIARLTADDAHMPVKAYLVETNNCTHRRMLESLYNSFYLNVTNDAVAAKARKEREEAILNNDQKLLRHGYEKLIIELDVHINEALSASVREIFYYVLLHYRLMALGNSTSVITQQSISAFLQLDTKARDKFINESEEKLALQHIPSSQELINYLALHHRYTQCKRMFGTCRLASIDEFLALGVAERNAMIEEAEDVLARNHLPTQREMLHYLTLLYCCTEQDIVNDIQLSPLHLFLEMEAKQRNALTAFLKEKLNSLGIFEVPDLSEHHLSELLAIALHEPLTIFLSQYLSQQTLKALYLACLPDIHRALVNGQKEWLIDHPVTQLKVGGNRYKLLILKRHIKAKINENALQEALHAYEKLLTLSLEHEKQFLQETPLSLLQLLSKYTAQTEAALKKIIDIDCRITECKDALEKKREEISKEFEEVVKPKEQENLRGTIIGRRQELVSEEPHYLKIFDACREGDLDKLITAISEIGEAFDIRYAYANNRSALDIACLHAQVAIVRHLVVERKADVNLQISGASPLVYALRGLHHYPSRIEIIRILLENGARLNFTTTDKSGNTPLHIAAQQGNVRGVELLAQWIVVQKPQEGFSINATNSEDRTALLEAIYADRRCKLLPVIEMLLSYGMCLRAEDIAYIRRHPNFNQKIMSAIIAYINRQAGEFDSSQNYASSSAVANLYNEHRVFSANVPLSHTSPRVRRGSFLAAVMPNRSSSTDAQQLAASVSSITSTESPRQRSGSISFGTNAPMPSVSPRKVSLVDQPLEPALSTSPRISATSAAVAAASLSDPVRRNRSNSVKGFFVNVFSSSRENSPVRSNEAQSPTKSPQTLFEAVRAKDHDAVKRILNDLASKHKLSIAYVRDETSARTALQEAVLSGEKECIKFFYEAGICLSRLDCQMLMPLLKPESKKLLVETLHEMAQAYALDNISPQQQQRLNAVASPRRIHAV